MKHKTHEAAQIEFLLGHLAALWIEAGRSAALSERLRLLLGETLHNCDGLQEEVDRQRAAEKDFLANPDAYEHVEFD